MEFTNLNKNLPLGENTGGLPQKVYFGLHADVGTCRTKPDAPTTLVENAVLTGDIVMKTGKNLFELYFTDDTGEFSIETIGETDGKSFLEKLSLFHPGLQTSLLGFINTVKNDNLILIVEDEEGQHYLMGDSARPAVFTGSPDGGGTGKETAARKGMSMEFTYKTGNVYVYTGAIPLTPAV